MEKYKNFIKMEEMRELLHNGKAEEALEIAETFNMEKVRDIVNLNTIAEVFLENGMLIRAKEYYSYIYGRRKTRRVVMHLVNISIRLKNIEDAERYYAEYLNMSKDDYYKYIYRYSIDKMEGKPYSVLTDSLQKLKKAEYTEVWAYELAKLYHKSGDKKRCIEECNDIVIWFGYGEIVDKAKALRAYCMGDTELLELDRIVKSWNEDKDNDTDAQFSEEDALNASDGEEAPEYKGDMDTGAGKTDDSEAEIRAEEARTADTKTEDTKTEDTKAEAIKPGDIKQETRTEGTKKAKTRKSKSKKGKKRTEEIKAGETEAGIKEDIKAEEIKTENTKAEETEAKEIKEEAQAEIKEAINAEDIKSEAQEDDFVEEMIGKLLREEMESMTAASEADEQPRVDEQAEVSAAQGEAPAADDISERGLIGYQRKGNSDSSINKDGYLAKFLETGNCTIEECFGFFAYQGTIRTQLIKNLENLLNPQIKNICLAISGESKSGRHTMAKEIIKLLFKSGILQGRQVAILKAEKINAIELDDKTDRLSGNSLLIENAGGISREAAEKLLKFGEKLAGKTAVFLIDSRSALGRLFKDNRELNGMFPNRIHIPDYGYEDLLDAACLRLEQKEYRLSNGARAELEKAIKEISKRVRKGALAETDKYITGILDRYETRKAQAYINSTLSGRKMEDNNVLLGSDITE